MKNSPETLRKRNELRKYWKDNTPRYSYPTYINKICKDCNLDKPCKYDSQFSSTGNPIYRSRCQSCYKTRVNNYVKVNRPKFSKQKLIRNHKRKDKCIDYLGGSCSNCGYNKSRRALTFHHEHPETKNFDISAGKEKPWKILREELDKCILLCFNCHMEVEEELQEFPNGSNWEYCY